VERVDGVALVVRGGKGTPVHVHLGDPLFRDDVIVTEASGSVEMRLLDGSILTVRGGSRLKINERGWGNQDAPTVMLHWGRLLGRSLAAVGEERFSVETPTVSARLRGTEFEIAVAEDLATVVSVYHGKVEVEAEGDRVLLGAQKEVEVEFLERPGMTRSFKEKVDADWSAWMVARSRNLPTRLPDLVGRLARGQREIMPRRREERTALANRLEEMERLARGMEETPPTDANKRRETVQRFREIASQHRQSWKGLQRSENRAEAVFLHAERLQKRAKGMKNELGGRYAPVNDSLGKILDRRKEVQQILAEDQSSRREHREGAGVLWERIPELQAPPAPPAAEKEPQPATVGEKGRPSQLQKGASSKTGTGSYGRRLPAPATERKSVSPRGAGARTGTKPQEGKARGAVSKKKTETAPKTKKQQAPPKPAAGKGPEKGKKEKGKSSGSPPGINPGESLR
jgi:hypothetical protein